MSMPITIEGKEYLSTIEATKFLGVSDATLINLRRKYSIVPKKRGVGKTLYYEKERLQQLLEFRDAPRDE